MFRKQDLNENLVLVQRWTALSGEPPVDDTDVDDWMLRFLVIRGSSICFYLHATGVHCLTLNVSLGSSCCSLDTFERMDEQKLCT